MKRKKLWSVLLVAVLAFSLGLGSMALYTRVFTSNNNKVRTAKFKVSDNGTLDEKFDLTDNPIYPGFDEDVYNFEIDKKDTEVPVKYTISVSPNGALFESNNENPSPVIVSVLRQVGEDWVDIGSLNDVEIIPDEVVEKFKIHIEWPHNDDIDADFEDLNGVINIEVKAQQMEAGDEEEDPDEEPELVEAIYYYIKRAPMLGYIGIQVDNIDNAAKYRVEFVDRSNLNDPKWKWSDIKPISEEIPIAYQKGEKVTIEIYAENETTLLHTFENVELTMVPWTPK